MSEQAQEARESRDLANVEYSEIVIGKAPRNGDHADLDEERLRLGMVAKDGVALCLSGGGIRSATFSLGVIQALARLGWLKKFTYLSTVSGGGYIGSWLSSWIRRAGIDNVASALSAEKGLEPEEIRRLRASSNYLSPRAGVSADLLTLVSTFLRNLFINWAILVPVLIVITMLPLANVGIAYSMIDPPDDGSQFLRWTCIVLAGLFLMMALVYTASDVPDGNVHQTKRDHYRELVYFPVLAACYLLSLALMQQVSTRDFAEFEWWMDPKFHLFLGVGALFHPVAVSLGNYWVRRKRGRFVPSNPEPRPVQLGKRIPWWGRPVAFVVFLALSGAFAGGVAYLGLRFGSQLHHLVTTKKEFALSWSAVYATVAVPFLLLCFFLGSVFHVALIRRNTDEGAREWWGRSGGTWLQMAFVWLALHFICIWLPVILSRYSAGTAVVGGGALGGVLVAVIGYYSKHKPDPKQAEQLGVLEKLNIRVLDLLSLAFMCSLLVIITLCAVDVGADLQVPRKQIFLQFFFDLNTNMPWKFITLLLAGVFALVFSKASGVNAFSMHAMYGNRLVRAYMGATRPLSPPQARMPHAYTGFDPDDDLPMSEELRESEQTPPAEKTKKQPTRPFHVINTALNIVRPSGEHLEWQERKAASFTITPLRTGSRLTGFCRTGQIGGRADVNEKSKLPWGVTIGRAMTISGAAAAPNMGFHSSKLVAIVMTFFNVRLGWWMRNPAPLFIPPKTEVDGPSSRIPTWLESLGSKPKRENVINELCQTEPANALRALIAELTGDTREDSDYVYLSDGGHFENLGLYEMVRRQCKEIVVVDAGCDPKFEYEDLERAIRIIRNDFNAEIEITDLPTAESIKATKKHHAFGTIRYRNGKDPAIGTILYIKPGLDGDEPLDVDRYAARSIAKGEPFPHQSTADQFFDEPQFESYRALGQYSVKDLPAMALEVVYPIEAFQGQLAAQPSTAANAAATSAAPSGSKTSAAGEEKKTRGFGEALSGLVSWDKLPGLVAAALGSTAVITTLTPEKSPTTTVEQPASVPGSGTPPSGPEQSIPVAPAVEVSWNFPLRGFGEGQLCRKAGPTCDDGARLSKAMIRKLAALNTKLAECGPSLDTELAFTVRGYASTSEFSMKRADSSGTVVVRHPESERLNLALADARANEVSKYLEAALRINRNKGDDAIVRWMTGVDATDKAAVHARFAQLVDVLEVDRDEAEFDRGAAGDNRRVDIDITKPGNCNQKELLATMRAVTASPVRTASTN